MRFYVYRLNWDKNKGIIEVMICWPFVRGKGPSQRACNADFFSYRDVMIIQIYTYCIYIYIYIPCLCKQMRIRFSFALFCCGYICNDKWIHKPCVLISPGSINTYICRSDAKKRLATNLPIISIWVRVIYLKGVDTKSIVKLRIGPPSYPMFYTFVYTLKK